MSDFITLNKFVGNKVVKYDYLPTQELADARVSELVILGFTDAFVIANPGVDVANIIADPIAKTITLDLVAPAKEEKLRNINQEKENRIELKVSFNGNDYDTDPVFREWLSGMMNSLNNSGPPFDSTTVSVTPGNVMIISSNGTEVEMSIADFEAMALRVGNYCSSVLFRHFQLTKSLNAATTIAEIDAIDTISGWPLTIVT